MGWSPCVEMLRVGLHSRVDFHGRSIDFLDRPAGRASIGIAAAQSEVIINTARLGCRACCSVSPPSETRPPAQFSRRDPSGCRGWELFAAGHVPTPAPRAGQARWGRERCGCWGRCVPHRPRHWPAPVTELGYGSQFALVDAKTLRSAAKSTLLTTAPGPTRGAPRPQDPARAPGLGRRLTPSPFPRTPSTTHRGFGRRPPNFSFSVGRPELTSRPTSPALESDRAGREQRSAAAL